MRVSLSVIFLQIIVLSFSLFAAGCLNTPIKRGISGDVPLNLTRELDEISGKSRVVYTKYYLKKGDTIWKVSKQFGVLPETIINVNNIKDVTNLKTGQMLNVPVNQTVVVNEVQATRVSGNQSSVSAHGYIWPIKNRVLRRFGEYKNGFKSTGLDIEAELNDDVLAAKAGRIIVVANNTKGWGKVVVMEHANDEKSLYAYNSKIFVQKGMQVQRGHVIAKAGQSGKAVRPGLHFKIFKKDKPVDPLFYLSY